MKGKENKTIWRNRTQQFLLSSCQWIKTSNLFSLLFFSKCLSGLNLKKTPFSTNLKRHYHHISHCFPSKHVNVTIYKYKSFGHKTILYIPIVLKSSKCWDLWLQFYFFWKHPQSSACLQQLMYHHQSPACEKPGCLDCIPPDSATQDCPLP